MQSRPEDVVASLCPYCHVALVTLENPMRFKPMAPGGRGGAQTFTRQCPNCKVLQP